MEGYYTTDKLLNKLQKQGLLSLEDASIAFHSLQSLKLSLDTFIQKEAANYLPLFLYILLFNH